ncbi:hypothetical protein CU098_007152, partial [Rhizopus stolonifer]
HAQPNVILMISDGFGPASETFGRQYHARINNLPVKTMFPLDHIIVGQIQTQSSSSLITDSAAGATAFACGIKTFNGAIGVDDRSTPCGTLLESAKIHRQMKTGLVVKSRITHATPAAFSAHVNWRDFENDIAQHQIGLTPLGRTVDLMFGGGLCEFISNQTDNSCRQDDRDLLKQAKDQFGWHIMTEKAAFDKLDDNAPLPLMGLFAHHHMDYAMDRDPATQPSLVEMTKKALHILKKSKHGFFLMIEGSRIDMAAHVNDPAAHYYEILEYQHTVAAVMDFIDKHPNTLLISVSDHETGGLTVGRQVTEEYPEYEWNPEALQYAINSTEILSLAWAKAVEAGTDTKEFLVEIILKHGLGVQDTTQQEFDKLWAWKETGKGPEYFALVLSDVLSTRAQIGWTTMGHTGVDVNLYAYGHASKRLRGNHENTEIGDLIVDYLKLDLDDITKRLKGDKTWNDSVKKSVFNKQYQYRFSF